MAKRFFGIRNECECRHLCVGGLWIVDRQRDGARGEGGRDNIMEHLSMQTRDVFAKMLGNRKSSFKVR